MTLASVIILPSNYEIYCVSALHNLSRHNLTVWKSQFKDVMPSSDELKYLLINWMSEEEHKINAFWGGGVLTFLWP